METDIRRLMHCSRCGKDYPFDQVRYLPTGSGVACVTCLGVVQRERHALEHIDERQLTYQCVDCRYQFRRSLLHAPRGCPQCGGKRLLKAESGKLTSASLLRAATDPRLASLDDLPRGPKR
jgi:DNA-directed RNA polymerase subunit RPC12/RpoP